MKSFMPIIQFCAHVVQPRVAIFTTYKDENGEKKMDPTTESLKQVVQTQGLPVDFVYVDDFVLEAGDQLLLSYKGKPCKESPFIAVLPRIGARWLTEPMLRVLNQLQNMGATVLNSPEAIRLAEDKFSTHRLLAQHKIPQPRSLITQGEVTSNMLAGFPDDIIVKPNSDTSGGRGVRLLKKHELIGQMLTGNELVQEYVKNDNDVTYRYVFANGQCLSATQKQGGFGDAEVDTTEGDRLNASYKAIGANPKMVKLGLRVMQILGLSVASVDFVGNNDDIRVLEVNPSFGLERFEKAAVCEALLNYLVSFTKKPTSLPKAS